MDIVPVVVPVFLVVDKVLAAVAVGDRVVLGVAAAFWAFPVDVALAYAFFDKIRPVVEYNGCTWYHLPAWNGSADLPRNADAMFAIFAARMALSSLEIRSRFR